MATLPAKLDAIPAVDIDSGRFKYVLIRVDMQDAETKQEYNKVIVRGYNWAAFHGKCQQRSHTKKKKQKEKKISGIIDLDGDRIFFRPCCLFLCVASYKLR